MSVATKTGKKAIRAANGLVNSIIFIVVFTTLAFGCYAIWDSRQVRSEASAGNYERYKPTAGNALSFQELQDINPEVFSWLTVYGTNIDYPVVQGDNDNNIKYVNTNALGRYSISGAIFLDYKNKRDYSDFKSILFGHHMDSNIMFGEIGNFFDKNYFDARRYGEIFYDGQTYGLEFFVFAHTDAYDEKLFNVSVMEDTRKHENLEHIFKISVHIREDITVTTDDRLLLLATCSSRSTNGRDILVAKITDEVHKNPFEIENTDKTNIPVINGLPGLWSGASLWVKISVIALPALLILMFIVLIYIKRKRSNTN